MAKKLTKYVRYNEGFVLLRFFYIYFTIIEVIIPREVH